jgi:hypothetical protein
MIIKGAHIIDSDEDRPKSSAFLTPTFPENSHHGAINILNRAVKFRKSKCIRIYKIYEEQRKNIKHQKNFPEMWGLKMHLI